MKTKDLIFYYAFVLSVSLIITGCKSTKITTAETVPVDTVLALPEVKPIYRASRPRKIDILHTKLSLSFNWDSAFIYGEATLTLKPYFYPVRTIELDAQGFEFHEISEQNGDERKKLEYTYVDNKLTIKSSKEITAGDTLRIFIKYTAKPDKLKVKGSAAISDAKGMYFINKDGKDPDKPRQLWTQGETESNSCWFPTVDSPNEKFSHEIYVTIEEGQTSISNGLKLFSVENGNGTKTEYWKMDKPHSAYLVMLAVGPFAVYEDKWNDMEVNYFVDSAYLPYAKDIFGNTPEMLTFYSDFLGVKYPWQKYDQVVVHDYVSGAMENTTATIHGEFLQQTRRELLDYNGEDVISHELFHHWFGDLVTCESWSNLTLNEGFATYGEYLWHEHKEGRDAADLAFEQNLEAYLYESTYKNVNLIRFNYDDKEDVFDSHSYSKGGLILHMLRNQVGEKAFRQALKLYLTRYAYRNAEVHDLRLVFEEVTGEDLNWFFNQWFLASGHPVLEVNQFYNEQEKNLGITVEQKQDLTSYPLYHLPVFIEYKSTGKLISDTIEVSEQMDTVFIAMDAAPEYLNFNRGNIIPAEISQEQTEDSWDSMYRNSSLAVDQVRALDNLSGEISASRYNLYKTVLKHERWEIREYALDYFLGLYGTSPSDSIRRILFDMAGNDKDWRIRYYAIDTMKSIFKDSQMVELCKKGLSDSSIMITSVSISALIAVNPEEAGKEIRKITDFEYGPIAASAAEYYALYGTGEDHKVMVSILNFADGYSRYQTLTLYGVYLGRMQDTLLPLAIPVLKGYALEADEWWVRMAAINESIKVHERIKNELILKKSAFESSPEGDGNRAALQEELNKTELTFITIDNVLDEVKQKETREELVSLVTNYLSGNTGE